MDGGCRRQGYLWEAYDAIPATLLSNWNDLIQENIDRKGSHTVMFEHPGK